MNPSSTILKARRVREVAGADDLMRPGDFYIREVPIYNSAKTIPGALIMKCPYCGGDMMSMPGHRISRPGSLRKFLSIVGISAGISVTPKLVCPYNHLHSFSITNGKISAVQ